MHLPIFTLPLTAAFLAGDLCIVACSCDEETTESVLASRFWRFLQEEQIVLFKLKIEPARLHVKPVTAM